MGLLMAALVRTAGAASVSVVGLNEDRLAFAGSFGVDAAVTSADKLGRTPGFEVVVDPTGVVAALTQPESPRWLVGKGRTDEARTVLTRLRGDAGAAGEEPAEIAIGLLNMLMTLPAMRLIDRKGRKPLLLFGALGMCAAMVLLAVTNLSGLGYGTLLSVLSLLGIAGIALYIASFAISWGPVQWVMLPELFPMRIRAAAVSLCVLLNWLFNMIVALVFPSPLHAWGAGINFLFFAGTTLLAFLFVQRLLPETKGRSLEEIEQDLLRGRPARPEAEGSVPVSSGAASH